MAHIKLYYNHYNFPLFTQSYCKSELKGVRLKCDSLSLFVCFSTVCTITSYQNGNRMFLFYDAARWQTLHS